MEIKHPKKDFLTLDDIYIYPDIRDISDESTIKKRIYSVEEILKKYEYVYFLGTEEIGKTTLLKRIAKDYLEQNNSVIVLDGKDIKTTSIDELLKRFYRKYSLPEIETFDNSVLLIDDLSKQNLQNHHFEKLITELVKKFKQIIIFIDKQHFIQESGKYLKHNFHEVEILPFGFHKRHEFIKKWLTIGSTNDEENISNELYERIDHITSQFNTIMKKNIMDSRPIYLITIIQTLENLSQNGNFHLTSFGQCYQVLINEMLRKSKVTNPQDIDGVINFLSYISYYFYKNNIYLVSEDEFEKIVTEYGKKFVAITGIKEILLDGGIFYSRDNYNLQFSQKYLYYFCCAKYFSDNSQILQSEIEKLCKNIYNEQKANILIFLVHHLRGTDLLNEILVHTVCLLDNQKPFEMNIENIQYFKRLISNKVKSYVLESRNAENEREKILKKQDSIDEELSIVDLAIEDSLEELERDEFKEATNFKFFQESLSAVRSLEVLGQIAKNRSSSIEKENLKYILEVSYDAGLKVLNFYLESLNNDVDELKNLAKEMILQNNENISESQALIEAETLIHSICFSLCFYMIQLIAKATAHSKLLDLSNAVLLEHDTPANQLIHLYSRLLVSYQLPKHLIKRINQSNQQNPLVLSLLNGIVLNHVYLHNLEIRDRQWLDSTLGLSVNNQLTAIPSENKKLINNYL